MGYTHYFPQQREALPGEFEAISADLKRLYEAAGPSGTAECPPLCRAHLARSTRTGALVIHDDPSGPLFSDDLIQFNGRGGEDAGCEDFFLPKKHYPEAWDIPEHPFGFSSCKTNRRPYDLFVCCALIVCHGRAPGWLEIRSDGRARDETYPNAWLPALRLVRTHLRAEAETHSRHFETRSKAKEHPGYELPPGIRSPAA